MCGIYGITENNRQFIEKYINTCSHRGPDGHDIYNDDAITLGHNLLSITDDANVSKQPWKTPAGNILVYNGEIFNYFELLEKYPSFVPKTTCDTELLAWGLDSYGLNFIDQIDSMHGFAYYNPNKRELVLSRDHAGIKPVFYAEIKQGLVFGSEIKGMLDLVPGSRNVDNLSLSLMTQIGINVSDHTFFSGIKKLLSGQTIVYDLANKRIKTKHRIFIKPTSNHNFQREEFISEAKKTIKICSIGKRQIGVFLSGGLDSSLIAYELHQLLGSLNTFTNRINPNQSIPEDHNSDADAASIFAKKIGFNHREIIITPKIIEECWQHSIYHMEEPVYNPSMAMYCHTNKILSQSGTVITMAGDMGDEILGGYPKYWKLQEKISTGELKDWHSLIDTWMNRIKRPIKINMPHMSRDEIREYLIGHLPMELFNPKDMINSYMALDCITQVPEEFFSRNDRYGMAYGMEGRFPLATKSFMRYCLSIPSSFKIGPAKSATKLLTKIAYKGLLPDVILQKPKTGWTCPMAYWIKVVKVMQPFYLNSLKVHENVKAISALTEKTMVPVWMMKDWANRYNMQFQIK